MTAKSVTLHIDELILHGFAPGDRHRIGAAVQQELSRLLTEQGSPTVSGRHAVVNAAPIEVRSNARAEAIGGDIARAVHKGLPR